MAVRIKIAAEYDQRGLKKAQQELANFGNNAKKALLAVGVASAAVGVGLVKFGADSIAAAQNVEQANRRLEQVAKSMDLFGAATAQVSQRLIDFAEKNEVLVGVDGEVIKATQAKLLTFKELAKTADSVGGSFDRATMAALDLAAAGFGSAETNATQLGKALQDPIKGITALTRSGVTFTAQEKEKIKALVESGNILEAQNLILSAIETQVGGTAEATAKASDRMKLAFENILESVGEQLLPVFQDFTDEIIAMTPELEQGLAAAAEEVAVILREQVLPAIQDFTNWLSSPEGTQTIKDLAQALVDLIKGFVDFVGFVVANRETIATLATIIGGYVIAVKTATIATGLHSAALQIMAAKNAGAAVTTTTLSTALRLLPWAAAIAGATLFVSTMSDYADEVYGSKVNTEGMTEAQAEQARKIEGLQKLLEQYRYALENGTEANKKLAEEGIARVEAQLESMGVVSSTTRAEINRFNQIKLNGLKNQIQGAAGELNRFNNIANNSPALGGPFAAKQQDEEDGSKKTYGESAAAKAKRERLEGIQKARDAIKNAQKQLASAQTTYNKNIQRLTEDNANAILRIQNDFNNRLADIGRQSRERLTSAFKSATGFALTDFFEIDENKSVDNLVKGLKDKLAASKQLLTNAAQLSSSGFSQTFIEQVVSAGTTTGNELANAILASTPEAQKELQDLFSQIETTANTGMDELAQQIYDKQGLATLELKNLYATTQTELTTALAEQQASFQKAVTEAADGFIEEVAEIKAKLKEDLEAIGTDFSVLDGKIGTVNKTLDTLIAKWKEVGQLPAVTLPDFKMPSFTKQETIPTSYVPAGSYGNNPTIVLNVKTDTTQSTDQVGRKLAAVINKYTSAGGAVFVGRQP